MSEMHAMRIVDATNNIKTILNNMHMRTDQYVGYHSILFELEMIKALAGDDILSKDLAN